MGRMSWRWVGVAVLSLGVGSLLSCLAPPSNNGEGDDDSGDDDSDGSLVSLTGTVGGESFQPVSGFWSLVSVGGETRVDVFFSDLADSCTAMTAYYRGAADANQAVEDGTPAAEAQEELDGYLDDQGFVVGANVAFVELPASSPEQVVGDWEAGQIAVFIGYCSDIQIPDVTPVGVKTGFSCTYAENGLVAIASYQDEWLEGSGEVEWEGNDIEFSFRLSSCPEFGEALGELLGEL